MTLTPTAKKNPPFLIFIGIIFIAVCVFCVITSLAMDALGLLPTSTPSPISNATSTLIPTQIPETPTLLIGKSLDDYLQEFGGKPDVYLKILTLTDCAALQEEFNIAYSNNARETPGTEQFKWTLGYMTAADDQMKYLDCYTSTPIIFTPDIRTATPLPTRTSFITATLPANCYAAYPQFCIPINTRPSCDQLPSSNFLVLPPDPQGYDGDNDGIGCEN